MPFLLFGIGAAVSGIAAYMNYQNTSSMLSDQANMSMQSATLQSQMMMAQSQMSMMQSSMLSAQAGMFGQSAAAFQKQAGMFMEQSDWAVRIGKIKAAQEYARARQTETEADRASTVAAEKRRLAIGEGITSFAGHGVSVDASQSVALWEQDEIADLAVEMNNIKEKRDNEVWGYVWQGDTERMQSLFDAQSYAISAQGALINAGTERMKGAQAGAEAGMAVMQSGIYRMQSANALLAGQAAVSQANSARQNALWGMIGSIAGIGSQAGLMFAGGGFGGGGMKPAPQPISIMD